MSIKDTLINAKKLSEEERRRYCNDWKASGLKASQFCIEQQIPFSSFLYWLKRYSNGTTKKAKVAIPKGFSPVTLKRPMISPAPSDNTLLDIDLKLPNQIQLQLTLSNGQLLKLIQGICDATSIIR